jgi:hypothetical protein
MTKEKLQDASIKAEKAIHDGPVVGARWAVPILAALAVLLQHEADKAGATKQ